MQARTEPTREPVRSPLRHEPLRAPQDEQVRFRLIAREILSDIEHLLVQNLRLTRLEIARNMRFFKAGFICGGAALVFGIAALLSLAKALALQIGLWLALSSAGTELVHALLLIALLGIAGFLAMGAIKKIKELPLKLSKQWKDEWQWLRKTL